MRNRNNWLILIVILVAFSLWIDLSKNIAIINPFNDKPIVERNVDVKLGLDLRGGLQALLEADVPADTVITAEELTNAKNILQNRANALGVSEITMQTAGDRRIVAEFPGVTNPEEVVATLKQTALLEFVDMGSTPVAVGSLIQTDFGVENPAATTESGETIYHTVITGAGLETASVTRSQAGAYEISFILKSDSTNVFAEYTTANRGKYLAIVLDKQVVSAPTINDPITDGQGVITGNFTQETAQTLAVQLRSGALPIPIKVVESRTIGATLGEESIRKSVLAGLIGLSVVILFMAFNYQLPGLIADMALICYALFSLMLFKLIPVTLTLPGIAGFILSVGMAVDANVLIFERLKEELRAGRNIRQAIDLAWSRAWPSIRDSNTSTLITCVILFLFGNTFGASMVKGFSVTLALGVGISLFTAIIVTRTFLHTVLDGMKLTDHPRWFGL
ncbi:MAG TPA: protein translocase subunit SecD [Anaerolineales bacterium]|jgi:preprotein translocase subunit SecD|nr:protein translocase subunit SecD [Anaerolineales bacterium]